MRFLRSACSRLWLDYFVPSREAAYRRVVDTAVANGYQILPLADCYRWLSAGSGATEKVLAMRHDVDIVAPQATRKFFAIENERGARSTFYFRLNTAEANRPLIADLLASGFEVGYHFEETSTVAKQQRLRTVAEIERHRAEIQDRFQENVRFFRARYNENLQSVCAHGDWINRRFKLSNETFVDDEQLRQADVLFEAYQPRIRNVLGIYVSDTGRYPPMWANDYSPIRAMDDGVSRIYVLTHERNWFPCRLGSTAANLKRIGESLAYHLGAKYD